MDNAQRTPSMETLHTEIEQAILQNGPQQTRQILSAWLMALSRHAGQTFTVAGRYKISIRDLH